MNKDYIYKRRLLRLADFLDKLPSKRFNYGKWAGNDWQGKADLSCGTVACAMGWASTIPSFRRLGLRLGYNYDISYSPIILMKNIPNSDYKEAGQIIFGLSEAEAGFLFVPNDDSYFGSSPDFTATPKMVAKHIRKFVKNKYK